MLSTVGCAATAWAETSRAGFSCPHTDPPRAPNVMRGKAEIGTFLERVAALPLTIELSREVIAADRIAFACLVTLGDGKQILEHVIADVRNGQIVHHVDVEAWD